jgi:hypothetical protein
MTKAIKLKRGNPPPALYTGGRGGGQGYRNLLELATTPKEWGQISVHANKISAREAVYSLRSGKRKVPPGTWEFRYAALDAEKPDSEYGVWARLIEEKEGDSA